MRCVCLAQEQDLVAGSCKRGWCKHAQFLSVIGRQCGHSGIGVHSWSLMDTFEGSRAHPINCTPKFTCRTHKLVHRACMVEVVEDGVAILLCSGQGRGRFVSKAQNRSRPCFATALCVCLRSHKTEMVKLVGAAQNTPKNCSQFSINLAALWRANAAVLDVG